MKQGKNIVKIEGKLLEKKVLGEGTGKAGQWKKLELLIRDSRGSEVPVTLMQSEFSTKDGKQVDNNAFKGLLTIMNEYASVAEVGEEKADYVSITRGSLTKNVYKNRFGEVKGIQQFESRYAKRVLEQDIKDDGATVSLRGVVYEVVPQNEGLELILRLLVPNYKGELEYYDLNATAPEAVAYIEENITSGQSLEVDADILYKTEIKEIEVKRDFGGTKKEKTFNRVRKLEVVGIDVLEEIESWQEEEIVTGVAEMNRRYENIKNSEVKTAAKPTTTKGFGVNNTPAQGNGDIPF